MKIVIHCVLKEAHVTLAALQMTGNQIFFKIFKIKLRSE